MDNVIEVNGVKYAKIDKSEPDENGYEYVIIRAHLAGVFAGYLKSRNGKEAKIVNARRIYYWKGAASLSQLAMEGVKYPDECKFAMPVNITLTEVIEVIETTKTAQNCIEKVKIWKV